ncbi:MAG: CDP-archaeol synthase [Salinisphaeraceae bacterium]|nr:CDP-archaeol synthase [Salinisphaeraceae bacterium]
MTAIEWQLLLLIMAANAAPILANHLMPRLGNWPIDAGLEFFDGQPFLGASKTWRGLISALILSVLLAAALRLPVGLALGVACLAMLGDLISSFTKRRLQIGPSGKAVLLDQIPESLLPALLAQAWLGLPFASVVWIVFLFFILELAISPLAYRMRIRKRPY